MKESCSLTVWRLEPEKEERPGWSLWRLRAGVFSVLLSQLLVVAAVSCIPGLVGVPLPSCLHVATTLPPVSLCLRSPPSISFLEASLRNLRLGFYLLVFIYFWLYSVWNLGSLTWGRTCAPRPPGKFLSLTRTPVAGLSKQGNFFLISLAYIYRDPFRMSGHICRSWGPGLKR